MAYLPVCLSYTTPQSDEGSYLYRLFIAWLRSELTNACLQVRLICVLEGVELFSESACKYGLLSIKLFPGDQVHFLQCTWSGLCVPASALSSPRGLSAWNEGLVKLVDKLVNDIVLIHWVVSAMYAPGDWLAV